MIDLDAKHVMARDEAFLERYKEPTLDPGRVPALRWEPVAGDVPEAGPLFEYLSPEVRRFAVVMETLLREAGDKPDERPRVMYERMLRESGRLRDALSHRGVTNQLHRPLPEDHPDRNPRRVANVLKEAASVACHALRIADACGAMEEGHG